MPYLEYLYCEKCGEHFPLDIDYVSTIESYRTDGRENPSINSATLVWDYLIYNCNRCRQTFKYTYRDVERRVRDYLSSLSRRYAEYFDRLSTYQSTEQARTSGEFFVKEDSKIKARLDSLYKSK